MVCLAAKGCYFGHVLQRFETLGWSRVLQTIHTVRWLLVRERERECVREREGEECVRERETGRERRGSTKLRKTTEAL